MVDSIVTIREQMEMLERTSLNPFAMLSENSKGRERPEEECDIRPVFQRDRDRILHFMPAKTEADGKITECFGNI